jgi:hypothetical protein
MEATDLQNEATKATKLNEGRSPGGWAGLTEPLRAQQAEKFPRGLLTRTMPKAG